MAHTPGPWTWKQFRDSGMLCVFQQGTLRDVAGIYRTGPTGGPVTTEEDLANAALIAEAPNLIDHARWVLRLMGTDNEKGKAELAEHVEKLWESIRRADGK